MICKEKRMKKRQSQTTSAVDYQLTISRDQGYKDIRQKTEEILLYRRSIVSRYSSSDLFDWKKKENYQVRKIIFQKTWIVFWYIGGHLVGKN